MTLPEKFKERMTAMLGKTEAEKLFYAICEKEAVKAFRVNKIKTDVDSFERSNPKIDRKKTAFPPDAYITHEEFPSVYPCHHTGAVYMQDLSAMSTVTAAEIPEGAYVLDTCSAPGGKTGQLAASVGERGVVVANEYDRKRCRILQGNIERMGAKNTVICSDDTAVLAKTYPEIFDIVLCDAPCSGEGMFRKNERAVGEWSEENVKMCARRQREILANAAECVKPGGKLIYSTCTFSLEENEENVAWLLSVRPDFSLAEVTDELKAQTSDGISIDGQPDMTPCRRIYPHLSLGEGQFIALLERNGAQSGGANANRTKEKIRDRRDGRRENKKSRNELDAVRAAKEFLEENLTCGISGELIMLGNYVFLSPNIVLPEHNVFAAGVCIGEFRNGRIIPHHQLFSAFGKDFKLKIELSGEMDETKKYLSGEEISVDGLIEAEDGRESGWAAVMIDGCAAGGAKISGGYAKNHYPKGLRNSF